jgi:hypothetical protein
VRKDVKRGVVPVDEFSVVPDFFGLADGHVALLDGLQFENTGEVGKRQSVRSTSVRREEDKLAR